MERAVVLIDGGYLSKIIRKFFPEHKVDYLVFSELLCDNCNRVQTYYYDCMPYQSGTPTYEERSRYARADRFMAALRKLDKFTVRLGRLIKTDDGFQQKGVDVLFAIDLSELSLTNSIDIAYVVPGDSDFVPAVEQANRLGIKTVNVHHPTEFSYHLRDVCRNAYIINLEIINKSKLVYKTRK